MSRKWVLSMKWIGFWAVLAGLIIGACQAAAPRATEAPQATAVEAPIPLPTEAPDATPTGIIGMPNPASVYCEQQGGRLEIRTDAQGGQSGTCIFADGSECEEWAYFRGECAPGQSRELPTPYAAPRYLNEQYGFSMSPPADWTIEEKANQVIFRYGEYFLFVGFQRPDEERIPFRTGMPAGDFVDGGTFTLLGTSLPRKYLVAENKIKVVEYGSRIPAGGLLLSMWLDGQGDYRALDIPKDIIAIADQIVASFTLISP